ncbi:MAG TPA: HAMP domain-containing sensor histidine kinase [Solirubrobacteraceae bacterium]
MASLRARLTVAVLVLTAVGLLLLGAITYAEQRSFLYDRVDQQLRAAMGPAGNEARGPAGGPGYADHKPPPGGFGLPPGSYVQRRYPSGEVSGGPVETLNQTVTAKPALPDDMPVDRIITVDGQKGTETSYRALAAIGRDGTMTVAAIPLRATDDNLHRLLAVEALVIAAVLALLGVISWIVVRVGLLPLDRMGHTAGAIAAGDLSHRVESTDPRTEVGRLGIALNAMLDRLEQAFGEREASEDRLRRFIADASHELRTPLASIRGYAELFRMGAAREPAEVEKAMRRIEDESARMGVLVDDLLMLARLDEVADAPYVEVDLAAVVRDAVDDGRAMAPDREIETRIDEDARVIGDGDQLRQVLGNLLRNAFVHTPAGAPVEVTLERDGGEARLEVRDHGPGLPTGDAEALFERFWRSEGGRERGKGGAGLGLAIVAAIVDAHGGRVWATNAPGGGASFVVTLPATSQAAPTAL